MVRQSPCLLCKCGALDDAAWPLLWGELLERVCKHPREGQTRGIPCAVPAAFEVSADRTIVMPVGGILCFTMAVL